MTTTIKYKGCLAGYHIAYVAREASRLSKRTKSRVTFDFNDVLCEATPKKSPMTIVWEFQKACDDQYYRPRAVIARAIRNAQYRKEHELKVAKQRLALSEAPASLTLRDEAAWAKCVEVYSADPYSKAVIEYASVWARLMEGEITKGKTLRECADDTSHLANTDGITGFMYGCVVGILAQVWIFGEELRRWHNKSTQLGSEGDQANEKEGAVLNPALLTVG